MNHKIDRDTYIIPPNFIESGTFFGGMFKARNVIEAGILAFAIGVPVFSLLPLGLTARIIALCLTALPAALVALIGVSGESLSSFLLIFIKYLRNRRIVGGNSAEDAVPATEHGGKHIKKKAHKPDKAPRRSRRSGREDFPAEFDEVRSYEIRQKLRPVKKQKPAKEKKAARQKKKVSKERKVKRPIRTQEPKPACLNPVADYLPISKIENGIIYTKDHRYVKVVEVVPINFMLRSAQEQRNIIYSFVSYLKISPIKLQIKVLYTELRLSMRTVYWRSPCPVCSQNASRGKTLSFCSTRSTSHWSNTPKSIPCPTSAIVWCALRRFMTSAFPPGVSVTTTIWKKSSFWMSSPPSSWLTIPACSAMPTTPLRWAKRTVPESVSWKKSGFPPGLLSMKTP